MLNRLTCLEAKLCEDELVDVLVTFLSHDDLRESYCQIIQMHRTLSVCHSIGLNNFNY